MESQNKSKKRNSVLWKGCFVLLVALVLQIPILMVRGVVNDRKELSGEVNSEVSSSWGGILVINAPELIIPYSNLIQKDGKTYKEKSERKISTSEVTIDSNVDTEILHRSIYDIPVYTADLTFSGKMSIDNKHLENHDGDIRLSLPVGRTKGIEGRPVVVVAGREYPFKAQNNALVAVLPYEVVSASQELSYTIHIKSKGMDRVRFYPSGSIYTVNMKSDYSSPSFKGDYLPVERTVCDSGFTAKWVVTDLNTVSATSSIFDVELIIPANQYQQTERAMKYSFLIILLVFLAIYLVESITRCRINIVQYIVTGLSLCLFYLLLLSISEFLSFGLSYAIAAVMTTGALGAYFYGFLKSKFALFFTGAVACLYGFIYVLLQMETGSLLAGTLALFLILCVIMYFTRRNDLFDQPRNPVIE
ncbi:MAG: cell envelope integrity protein CreD [Bacteroidales bacterium]|nr:cell envelope integrity protein CreD [Bacteroidales bacterium]